MSVIPITSLITGPHNGPVMFSSLTSVDVCKAAGGRAGRQPGASAIGRRQGPARRRSGGRHCTAGQYGYVP